MTEAKIIVAFNSGTMRLEPHEIKCDHCGQTKVLTRQDMFSAGQKFGQWLSSHARVEFFEGLESFFKSR